MRHVVVKLIFSSLTWVIFSILLDNYDIYLILTKSQVPKVEH